MSALDEPRPLGIVTGMLGSGKTTMLRRLLADPAMADTMVLVNEIGEVGLDHRLLTTVSDAVVLLPNGCLCCRVKADALQTLRDLRRAWLSGALPDVGRVLVETTGLAEPAPLVAAIAGDPLLLDSVALAAVTTVVDGTFGHRQIDARATCRNQIRIADHLLISKSDLAEAGDLSALERRLGAMNGLARVGRTTDVRPALLFDRDRGRPRSAFVCAESADHLDGVGSIALTPCRPFDWAEFKTWLGAVLETHGATLLRLKGCLAFRDHPTSLVIQAVHDHFYPVVDGPDDADDAFLVLVYDRNGERDLLHAIAQSPFRIVSPSST